ncbi:MULTISPECIES: hypothetical protein [unclassified Roseovarius]|uniref:hypothetical protein n=1 Tax=unclassified Roseovarius TaxID=2614913 RepID=UPI00273EC7E0|nr:MULTISPECIES: hypothetical protein [unclassified Roseovarius]
MTNYKDALVLMNDLEEFAETHRFPEAENLIAKARMALEKDIGGMFPPVRKSPRTSRIYLIQ